MNLNSNINLENVKVSRFGWTSMVARLSDGSFKSILVKKNLFSGYTLMVNNKKTKISNLFTIGAMVPFRQLIEANYIGRASTGTLESFQRNFDEMNQVQQGVINQAVSEKNMSIQQAQQIQKDYEEKLNELKKRNEIEKQNEINSRINFLSSSFKKITLLHYKEEGTDIRYEKPNALQLSIGRTIGNEVKEPYTREFDYDVDMKEYLEYIIETTENENIKLNAKMLANVNSNINSSISELNRNYSMELYTQTVSKIALFIDQFKNFLINCKSIYKKADIYYYKRSSVNGQNDEPITTTVKTESLLKDGIEACKKMIEKFISKEASIQFEKDIEEISKVIETGDKPVKEEQTNNFQVATDNDLIDSPKVM